jgi:hypothetical protein
VTERRKERPGRPESPGWTVEEAAEYDRLQEALRQAAGTVQCHPHWARCKAEGADMVAARQALKRAKAPSFWPRTTSTRLPARFLRGSAVTQGLWPG